MARTRNPLPTTPKAPAAAPATRAELMQGASRAAADAPAPAMHTCEHCRRQIPDSERVLFIYCADCAGDVD